MYTVHRPSGRGLNFGSTAAVPRLALERVRTDHVDRMYSRMFVVLAWGAGTWAERTAPKRSAKRKTVDLTLLRNRCIPRLYMWVHEKAAIQGCQRNVTVCVW